MEFLIGFAVGLLATVVTGYFLNFERSEGELPAGGDAPAPEDAQEPKDPNVPDSNE